VNQYGQSRKHIFDSVQLSLKRLQLDYIDVLQCSLPVFFLFVTSVSYLSPRVFPRQAIVLIMKLPSRKWCVMPLVTDGGRQGN